MPNLKLYLKKHILHDLFPFWILKIFIFAHEFLNIKMSVKLYLVFICLYNYFKTHSTKLLYMLLHSHSLGALAILALERVECVYILVDDDY